MPCRDAPDSSFELCSFAGRILERFVKQRPPDSDRHHRVTLGAANSVIGPKVSPLIPCVLQILPRTFYSMARFSTCMLFENIHHYAGCSASLGIIDLPGKRSDMVSLVNALGISIPCRSAPAALLSFFVCRRDTGEFYQPVSFKIVLSAIAIVGCRRKGDPPKISCIYHLHSDSFGQQF
jgi:hypothetical protein